MKSGASRRSKEVEDREERRREEEVCSCEGGDKTWLGGGTPSWSRHVCACVCVLGGAELLILSMLLTSANPISCSGGVLLDL